MMKRIIVSCVCLILLLNVAALASAVSAEKFGDVKYLKTADKKKAEEIDADLEIDKESGEIRVSPTGSPVINVAKTQITNIIYERTSRPRYVSGLLIAWPLLFTKGKKHFMTIQYKTDQGKGEFILLHLDKDNYQQILASAEAATGLKVEKMID